MLRIASPIQYISLALASDSILTTFHSLSSSIPAHVFPIDIDLQMLKPSTSVSPAAISGAHVKVMNITLSPNLGDDRKTIDRL